MNQILFEEKMLFYNEYNKIQDIMILRLGLFGVYVRETKGIIIMKGYNQRFRFTE